jgi:hypothetical protein
MLAWLLREIARFLAVNLKSNNWQAWQGGAEIHQGVDRRGSQLQGCVGTQASCVQHLQGDNNGSGQGQCSDVYFKRSQVSTSFSAWSDVSAWRPETYFHCTQCELID